MIKLSKAKQQILDRWMNSSKYSIRDVYKDYSYCKYESEQRILKEKEQCGGWGYKILGFNTCCFSCAYLFQNKEDGGTYLVYHTKENKRVFRVQ